MSRIHFVGIGGVGINALAKFARDLGFSVSGSDAHVNELARAVEGRVYEGVDVAAVEGAQLLAYTEAARQDHPEIRRAKELGIPALPRQALLGEASALFERSVAVAGTHGKTTTTAMLTHILGSADIKFVAMIGGECVDGSNYVNNRARIALSEMEQEAFIAHCAGRTTREYEALKSRFVADGAVFVTEACEYKRSFLTLKPYIGIATNIEYDHPDCYASEEDVRAAFEEFFGNCRIKLSAYENSGRYTVRLRGDGIEKEISLSREREVRLDGKYQCKLELPMDGEYNLHNAMFAIAAAYALGTDIPLSAGALKNFAGVKRRFERAKDVCGKPVFFDFAHHPKEIECALERGGKFGRILAVFQPHTFSRTRAYLDAFAKTLGSGDGALVLMPTYAAREEYDEEADSGALRTAIEKMYPKKRAILARDAVETIQLIFELAPSHDVIMFIGAGDIYALKDML